MWYTCVYLVQENRNLIPDLWKASAVKVGTPGKTFVFRFIVSYWRTNDEIIVWVLQEVPFYSYCFKWITVQHCERFLKHCILKMYSLIQNSWHTGAVISGTQNVRLEQFLAEKLFFLVRAHYFSFKLSNSRFLWYVLVKYRRVFPYLKFPLKDWCDKKLYLMSEKPDKPAVTAVWEDLWHFPLGTEWAVSFDCSETACSNVFTSDLQVPHRDKGLCLIASMCSSFGRRSITGHTYSSIPV